MLDRCGHVASQDSPAVTPRPLPPSQDLEGFSNCFLYRKRSGVPQNALQHSPDKELPGLAGEEALGEFLMERLWT